ncbi:MAG TPA: hypothetical protein VF717_06530 [Pyrinomonadaceae bacterium]
MSKATHNPPSLEEINKDLATTVAEEMRKNERLTALLLDASTERDTLYETVKEALSDAYILRDLPDCQHKDFITDHLIKPLRACVAEYQKNREEAHK